MAQGLDSLRWHIGFPLQAHVVTQGIEKIVAGVPDGLRHIDGAVGSAGVNPAAGAGGNLLKNPMGFNHRIRSDEPFRQSRCRGNGLKGGARGRLLLQSVVVKGQGAILQQLIVVVPVYLVGQTVVVVARVGDAGQYLPRVRLHHHAGSGAGVQGQLGRRQLQIPYLLPQKCVGR